MKKIPFFFALSLFMPLATMAMHVDSKKGTIKAVLAAPSTGAFSPIQPAPSLPAQNSKKRSFGSNVTNAASNSCSALTPAALAYLASLADPNGLRPTAPTPFDPNERTTPTGPSTNDLEIMEQHGVFKSGGSAATNDTAVTSDSMASLTHAFEHIGNPTPKRLVQPADTQQYAASIYPSAINVDYDTASENSEDEPKQPYKKTRR